jgi:C-terminal processing protease CtpA/Prc
MNEILTAAMAQVINRDDLPRTFKDGNYRIGTVRFGAFVPQYDPMFNQAAAAAEKQPGVSEDQAMVAGFCAVVQRFITSFDELAAQSDAIVVDLRGNFGGFPREARLLSAAMNQAATFPTYDVFATGTPGLSRLTAESVDPSCGQAKSRRPLVVFTGTRSAGESMAAWLWAAGSPVIGERTIGAGGGFEVGSQTFVEPQTGMGVRISGNFTLLDPTRQLREGEMKDPQRSRASKGER